MIDSSEQGYKDIIDSGVYVRLKDMFYVFIGCYVVMVGHISRFRLEMNDR